MSDITKCANPEGCDMAYMCYRTIAPDDAWRQSYANFNKHNPTGHCDHHWPLWRFDKDGNAISMRPPHA